MRGSLIVQSGMALRIAVLAITVAALWASPAIVGQQVRDAKPTPTERPLVVTGPGPHVISADASLIAGARRGQKQSGFVEGETTWQVTGAFGDLRLFDADGTMVPYLIVPPPPVRPARVSVSHLLPLPATKTTSGFELAFEAPKRIDALHLAGLQAPFVKRVKIEGSADRVRWVELVASATVFDLPSDKLRSTTIALPATTQRYLRVVFDDTNSPRLPMTSNTLAWATEATPRPRTPPLEVTLPFEVVPAPRATSTYRLRLPGARLPIVALRLEVSNPEVHRQVRVAERQPEAGYQPNFLGHALLTRVARGDLVAGSLIVTMDSPRMATLDLMVEDGINQPLELTAVHAVFAEHPRIYFEAPDARPLVARYGRDNAAAPTYDLEAARALLDIDRASAATWGDPRPESGAEPLSAPAAPAGASSLAQPAPPATTVPAFGGPLDRGLFRYARTVAAGPPVVTHVPLDAAVLAHSSAPGHNLHDLRLADGRGRQIPYVLTSDPTALAVQLGAPQPSSANVAAGGRESRYMVGLPYTRLPAATLVLTTSARVFSRRVALTIPRPADTRHREAWTERLASSTWSHADESNEAPPLRVSIPPLDVTELVLAIDEGDNQPLPLGSARLELPLHWVSFIRPADSVVELFYGSDAVGPPRYDVAPPLREPTLERTPTALGDERALSGPPTPALVTPPVFWGVLAVATVVLLGLLARLLRATPEGQGPDAPML